ncbi:trypsin-like peptidase domain-containing protein [Acetobacteraceae bacterium H6797]|nr:trypsin-like peptidase domain-containing protein [Acetobacteraceae bacterium H6797]
MAQTVATLRIGRGDCVSTGAAVHLGQGRFLTASHVVDGTQPMLRGCLTGPAQPIVSFQGRDVPAQVTHTGFAAFEPGFGLRYLGGQDIALLQRPVLGDAPPAAPLCASGPVPGQWVLVVTPLRMTASRVLGEMRESAPAYGGYTELAMRLEPGESGGGVFDAVGHCLLGLVAHREDVGGRQRTRIVEVAALRRFMAAEPAPVLARAPQGTAQRVPQP